MLSKVLLVLIQVLDLCGKPHPYWFWHVPSLNYYAFTFDCPLRGLGVNSVCGEARGMSCTKHLD